jgi:diguanylate cyclase (GGDEF)-like protein
LTPAQASALLDLFRGIRSVAVARIDRRGVILDGNAGFFRLLPLEETAGIGAPSAHYFSSPSFRDLLELSRSDRQPVYAGLLTLGEPTGKTYTLTGKVYSDAHSLLVLAEHDIEDLERAYVTAIQLADELTQTQRKLVSAHRDLQLREEQVRALSLTDQLTGIANRRKLDETVNLEIDRVRRFGGRLALAMVDIDHFKRINDEFSHQVGDAVLAAVAAVIRSQTRKTDLPSRYGGEEFAILMPETSLATAVVYAERIREMLEASTISPLPWPVTASFGVAEFMAGESAESLFRRADLALYQAKRNGRNRVAAAAEPGLRA